VKTENRVIIMISGINARVFCLALGKRKLKGRPLLAWGKNGRMWIEEWFVRWGVGGRGACRG
jgi:hypothetical protein